MHTTILPAECYEPVNTPGMWTRKLKPDWYKWIPPRPTKDIDEEECAIERYFDQEEERTGVRPHYVHMVCRCKKCNPVRM